MITPCLRRLRHNLLIGSITITAAFLLINVLAIARDDLRPTILSNAALVGAATSWITVALLSVGMTLAARIDKLRLARDVEASRRTPERPEHLRLVAPPAPQPDRRPRLRLFTSAAPVLLLVTVAVLVGLGMMTPPNAAGGSSGGPVAQHEPTVRPATDTVAVAADAAHTAHPSSAAAPHAPAPSTGTTMPTSCATPPPSASSTPVTTAPSTTKTKHKKPAPTTGSTSSTAPTGSTDVSSGGQRQPSNN